MSEPQIPIPDVPAESAWVTAERRPSKPKLVVGSPPQTTWAHGAAPVQPERWKRTIGRPDAAHGVVRRAVVFGRIAVVGDGAR